MIEPDNNDRMKFKLAKTTSNCINRGLKMYKCQFTIGQHRGSIMSHFRVNTPSSAETPSLVCKGNEWKILEE